MTGPMSKYPIRSILKASEGYTLLSFDLAQAEAWVVAYLANCSSMKKALLIGGDKDYHSTSARALFNIPEETAPTKDQRYLGKKFNHSGNYGTSAMMITFMVNSESINPPYITLSVADAKRLHNKWKELYFEIPLWWESIKSTLNNTRTLRTPYGRQRYFYGQWGDSLFKEAYAYIPQSTVADHMLGATQKEIGIKGGVREVFKQIVPDGIRLLNTSHDSLILECKEGTENEIYERTLTLLKRPLLVNGEQFIIPVDCEVGKRWGEFTKYTGGAIPLYKG